MLKGNRGKGNICKWWIVSQLIAKLICFHLKFNVLYMKVANKPLSLFLIYDYFQMVGVLLKRKHAKEVYQTNESTKCL